MRLQNKVAIITGSSRGIGKAIAKRFATEVALVVTNSRKYEDAKATADEINASGGRAFPIEADVSKPKDVQKLVDETIKEYGKLDILVNNAGILLQEPLLEISEKNWEKIMEVNLKGVFLCLQTATKQMINQKNGGKIINIASIAGAMGFSNIAHCCSKSWCYPTYQISCN